MIEEIKKDESYFLVQTLLKEVEEMKNQLKELKKNLYRCESPELDQLYSSLAKAQSEYKSAKKNKRNPFYKSDYADYEAIVKSTRPALSKYGLSVIQRPKITSKGYILRTRLCHSSGQFIESESILNPPKTDVQSLGSYTTYIKRYDYSSMIGAITGDEDDDAETVMKEAREEKPVVRTAISKEQLKVLTSLLENEPELLHSLMKGYEIDKLSDLPKEYYNKCILRIKEIKEKK